MGLGHASLLASSPVNSVDPVGQNTAAARGTLVIAPTKSLKHLFSLSPLLPLDFVCTIRAARVSLGASVDVTTVSFHRIDDLLPLLLSHLFLHSGDDSVTYSGVDGFRVDVVFSDPSTNEER